MKKRTTKKSFNFIRVIPLFVLISLVTILFINSEFSSTGKAIETVSETTKTTAYIYSNGLVASYDSNGEEKFYVNDHLGGTSVVVDENGNKISEEKYYAFGEEKQDSGERFTYTGKEKDDSGLHYYGARFYDLASGRFFQPDPISGEIGNPQSLNGYAYVLNNPMKFVDPSGMDENPNNDEKERIINNHYGPKADATKVASSPVLNEKNPIDTEKALYEMGLGPNPNPVFTTQTSPQESKAQLRAQNPYENADPVALEINRAGGVGDPLLSSPLFLAGTVANPSLIGLSFAPNIVESAQEGSYGKTAFYAFTTIPGIPGIKFKGALSQEVSKTISDEINIVKQHMTNWGGLAPDLQRSFALRHQLHLINSASLGKKVYALNAKEINRAFGLGGRGDYRYVFDAETRDFIGIARHNKNKNYVLVK